MKFRLLTVIIVSFYCFSSRGLAQSTETVDGLRKWMSTIPHGTTCAGSKKSPTDLLQELNRRHKEIFGRPASVHSPTEVKVVNDIFLTQAKETLCEMLTFEAISPFGWYGNTTDRTPPPAAQNLAKAFGLTEFYNNTRDQVVSDESRRTGIQKAFVEKVQFGLEQVVPKWRELRSAEGRGLPAKDLLKVKQSLEESFRENLPYANHPYLRDYYNRVLTQAFQLGRTHPNDDEVFQRIKTTLITKSTFDHEVLGPTRKSLEGEALAFQKIKSKGSGVVPEEYRKTLGVLGAFSGRLEDAKESASLEALNRWYNQAPATSASEILGVADTAVSMIPVVGDFYSVGAESVRFTEQIQSCNPEIPMGLRVGMCENLEELLDGVPSDSSSAVSSWDVDFYGAVPDLHNCKWKAVAQLGMVAGAVVGASKYVRVAKRGVRGVEAVESVGKQVKDGLRSEVLGTSKAIRRGRQLSGQLEVLMLERLKTEEIVNALDTRRRRIQKQILFLGGAQKTHRSGAPFITASKDIRVAELESVERELSSLRSSLSSSDRRLANLRRRHSLATVRVAGQSPEVYESVHLKEHFLPKNCFGLLGCREYLRNIFARRGKRLTTFFPFEIDLKTLVQTIGAAPPYQVVTQPGGLVVNRFKTAIRGKKHIFSVVVCQNPRGCSNSKFGQIETVFPICGPGVKKLVGVLLKPVDCT